jgi:hypothetical protein
LYLNPSLVTGGSKMGLLMIFYLMPSVPPLVLEPSTWDMTLSQLVFSDLQDVFHDYDYLNRTTLPQVDDVLIYL